MLHDRPNIGVGSLVYARVVSAPRDSEPTLACTDVAGKAAGFGPLSGGLPFDLDLGAVRQLLSRPSPPVLGALGEALAFELVVGVNGRCWVNAGDADTCILVVQALQTTAATGAGAEAAVQLVRDLVSRRDGNRTRDRV